MVPKHVAHCKCQINGYQEYMEILTKRMDDFKRECETVRNEDAPERAKKKKKARTVMTRPSWAPLRLRPSSTCIIRITNDG
ncbi:hypothetical protein LIER_43483 [Lithospermum erythrorhizon]|uniref:Uncharacterized protein n=1 Tax=Lithospermum erythrorhizon TaxID=34254 RepID=A0AAV3Q7Y9_LITER